jgi:unsaturated rhamnogalacturonyl hydrolase
MASLADDDTIRNSLSRLAARGSRDLLRNEQHWGDAILCDGLLYAADALGQGAPASHAIQWFEPKLASSPNTGGWFWMWAAEALPALGLYLRTKRRGYLEYARAIVEYVEHKAPRTPDGAPMPHPPAVEVWVDVSYFVAPAMAMLGRIEKDDELAEHALAQLAVHLGHLLDPPSGLLWHVAYPASKTHSPCHWARGNSWFAIAATQVLGELRAGNAEARLAGRAEDIARQLARQLNSVVALQDEPTGLWHTVLDRSDSYLESSATAGFALALGRALKLGLEGLDNSRARAAYRLALAAICSKVDDEGGFTGASQQTPPGDFELYQLVPVGTAPFATGVCTMALAEALARQT